MLLGPVSCASFEAGLQFPYCEFLQGNLGGEGPSQIYELSCGLRGAFLAKPSLAPFVSAVVALLISGTEGRSR